MKTERFEMWVAGATALLIAVCAIGVSATFNKANAEDASDPAVQDPLGTQSQIEHQPGQSEHQPGQNQYDRQQHTANYPGQEAKEGCRASEIIGMTVKSTGDKEVGSIEDLMIGRDGKVKYAAVSFGGFLGMGDKLFAVPWDKVNVKEGKTDQDESYAHIDVSERTLNNKNGFDQDNWPNEADDTFEVGARTSTHSEDLQR